MTAFNNVTPGPSFRRERTANSVTAYLRTMILTGKLPPGERLRVEHLAAELSLSVTPIRESLLELFGEGYLQREPHRGYVVAKLTRTGFDDQVLVLAMITGELARRAAMRATADRIDELARLDHKIIDADMHGDRMEAEEANFQLHRKINKAAHSPRLAWMAQLHSHYVPRVTFESLASQPSPCDHHHHDIVAAVRARDANGARDTMIEHLINSGRLLAEYLDLSGGQNPVWRQTAWRMRVKISSQPRIGRSEHMTVGCKTVGSTRAQPLVRRPVKPLPNWEVLRAGMADMDATHDGCTRQTSSTESTGRMWTTWLSAG